MRGKIYTSYFRIIDRGKGELYSIARYQPKWLNSYKVDYSLTALAPSPELLRDWKDKKITWAEYTRRYYLEFQTDILKQQALDRLKKIIDSGQTVTLYCYESSDDPYCHRHLLMVILKNLNYDVEELS